MLRQKELGISKGGAATFERTCFRAVQKMQACHLRTLRYKNSIAKVNNMNCDLPIKSGGAGLASAAFAAASDFACFCRCDLVAPCATSAGSSAAAASGAESEKARQLSCSARRGKSDSAWTVLPQRSITMLAYDKSCDEYSAFETTTLAAAREMPIVSRMRRRWMRRRQVIDH
jgi:hypothetical protein